METSDAAVSRDILILFPNRLAQLFQFNITGLLGKLRRMNQIFAQRVQGLEQRRCKTTR